MNNIVLADNLAAMRTMPDACFDLIYIDPPFNTGKDQLRLSQTAVPDEAGRKGFGGKSYRLETHSSHAYSDKHEDFLEFLMPRLVAAKRLLKDDGSFFFHIDSRESHYCKVLLDEIFGRKHFMNEIVWAYDYGARSKKRWPMKHDVIFWYVKNPKDYVFRYEEIDRIPYMAPSLVGKEKAERGKTPTDVWWNTIVPTSGGEKTGYPTQKPLAILERIIRVHTRDDARILDFFAGSGSLGDAAGKLKRTFTMIDCNKQACEIMQSRLKQYNCEFVS
ncbi:MAG: site-specific DNA-methyltransferase [Armatimonadota bacterium]|nr:site-specific DNA-methyltransferase [Armatimonadota bacterium]